MNENIICKAFIEISVANRQYMEVFKSFLFFESKIFLFLLSWKLVQHFHRKRNKKDLHCMR